MTDGQIHLQVPNAPFIGSEYFERDFWMCNQKLKDGSVIKHPYLYMTYKDFRIFRPASTRKDREYFFTGEQSALDFRWNLWHDTFKRGLFYKALSLLQRWKVLRI